MFFYRVILLYLFIYSALTRYRQKIKEKRDSLPVSGAAPWAWHRFKSSSGSVQNTAVKIFPNFEVRIEYSKIECALCSWETKLVEIRLWTVNLAGSFLQWGGSLYTPTWPQWKYRQWLQWTRFTVLNTWFHLCSNFALFSTAGTQESPADRLCHVLWAPPPLWQQTLSAGRRAVRSSLGALPVENHVEPIWGVHTGSQSQPCGDQRTQKVKDNQQLQATTDETGVKSCAGSRQATEVTPDDGEGCRWLTLKGYLGNWDMECPIISGKVMLDEQITSSVDVPLILDPLLSWQRPNPSFLKQHNTDLLYPPKY